MILAVQGAIKLTLISYYGYTHYAGIISEPQSKELKNVKMKCKSKSELSCYSLANIGTVKDEFTLRF